jgi:PAX-interacting protein 1
LKQHEKHDNRRKPEDRLFEEKRIEEKRIEEKRIEEKRIEEKRIFSASVDDFEKMDLQINLVSSRARVGIVQS